LGTQYSLALHPYVIEKYNSAVKSATYDQIVRQSLKIFLESMLHSQGFDPFDGVLFVPAQKRATGRQK
jgi:hypothetical protein